MTEAIIIQSKDFDDLRNQIAEIHSFLLNQAPSSFPDCEEQTGGVPFAEKILNRSKSWIYKKIGELPHKKFGSTLVFDRDELIEYMRRNTIDPSKERERINDVITESAKRKLSFSRTK
jgi:hypothetical protein